LGQSIKQYDAVLTSNRLYIKAKLFKPEQNPVKKELDPNFKLPK
jgi:hypothetical protein